MSITNKCGEWILSYVRTVRIKRLILEEEKCQWFLCRSQEGRGIFLTLHKSDKLVVEVLKMKKVHILLSFVLIVLNYRFKEVVGEELSECKCEKLTDASKVKCQLTSGSVDDPLCSIVFEQANGDFDKPHSKCIGRNTFTTVGEYSGHLREIVVYCRAPYVMDLSFDGMIPHESIGVTNYRQRVSIGRKSFNQSTLIVSMHVEPQVTGRYVVKELNRVEGTPQNAVDFYIFAENGNNGPYLQNTGKTIKPRIVNERTLILPCKPFKHTTQVGLYKNGQVFRDYQSFNPKVGFVIDIEGSNYEKYVGQYECIPEGGNEEVVRNTGASVYVVVDTNQFGSVENPQVDDEHGLNLTVSGKWISCTADEKFRRDYRLVNMRARNPLESNLKKMCFVGHEECVGKRDGSFNRCFESPRYCKSVDFKEGGGIISCFSRDSTVFKEPHHYVLGLDGKTYLTSDPMAVPTKALLNIQVQMEQELSVVYTNITYNVSCIGVSYLFAQPLIIQMGFRNGSRQPLNRKAFDETSFLETYDISSAKVVFNNYKEDVSVMLTTEDVVDLSCGAFVWNSEDVVEYILPLTVKSSMKPTFADKSSRVDFILGQTNELECDYEGLPEPNVMWEKDGERLTDVSSKKLVVSDVNLKSSGVYICTATNPLGKATKSFIVEVKEPKSVPSYWITIGIPLFVIVGCILICVFLLRHYKRTRTGLSRAEIGDFIKGIQTPVGSKSNEYEALISAVPYSSEYEVMDGKFVLDETSLLGSGEYGLVYKGTIGERVVAVKTLKRNAEVGYLRSLLLELKVMIYLQNHPNIVNLLGANTKHLDKGIVYIMVEFCPLGNLENYLKKNRSNFVDLFGTSEYLNQPDGRGYVPFEDNLSTKDLLRWSVQISVAMEYLSSKNVIHGDLAARNVLLQNRETAKISDFGLSRRIYEYSNYIKQSKEPLPWRHLALESLKDLKFSVKSDVWAFGITLWEIFSLGEVPYPGMTWNIDFVGSLKKGLRMKKPKYANDIIFELQIKCWDTDESRRPNFSELQIELERLFNLFQS